MLLRSADPYKLLVAELGEDSDNDKTEGINQGGAASNAYLRLQFEDLLGPERLSLEHSIGIASLIRWLW